jgi:trehalose 6-phosphate synthase
VTENPLTIGVLSRRAPIGQHPEIGATLEHVGGLTRVLPTLAEFAHMNWTAVTTQSQLGLPQHYSLAKVSGQSYPHEIEVFLSEVDHLELNQSDWFCTHFIWPLLHDIAMPEIDLAEMEASLNSMKSFCNTLAVSCIDLDNYGYLVNDFQLSQVPAALKNLEPNKPVTFFLHTPWPKIVPRNDAAIKMLEFMATGMMVADVIQFQTQRDLQAFESFVSDYLPTQIMNVKLEVNPVSVDALNLPLQSRGFAGFNGFGEDEISYLHIARSDPIKNTLATINAFTELAKFFTETSPRSYLDLYIVPSRQQWPEYRSLLTELVECVEGSNAKLSFLNYSPIRIHVGSDYQRASLALTRYDYLIACSVADGLNLVVKEGAVLNNRNGVIISSKNVGAMAELGEFCIVAAEATEVGIAEALREAKNLSSESRRSMSAEIKRHIVEFDSSNWAQKVVANFKVLEKV